VLDGGEERLGLKHHAFTAAEGAVVHGAVAVVRERAEVVDADFDQAGVLRAAQDAVVERAAEEVGEDGDEVEAHRASLQLMVGSW
jgi:hypothetical protein